MKPLFVVIVLIGVSVLGFELILESTPTLYDVVEYYAGNWCIFRMVYDGTIDPHNPPLLETNATVVGKVIKWKIPEEKLLEVYEADSSMNLVVIHGMDAREYTGEMTPYKKEIVKVFKEIGERLKVNVFLFVYPTLVADPERSAERFLELTRNMQNIIIFAHSMGGLVAEHIASKKPDNVKGIVFSGTPHLGSPLADILFIDPDRYEEELFVSRKEAENLRAALLVSYAGFSVTYAPGYKFLLWGRKPEDFTKVPFVNLVGIIPLDSIESVPEILMNMITTSAWDTLGLVGLKLLADSVSVLKDEFKKTDGMVPYVSASYGGNTLVFNADHEDLYKKKDIIFEGLSYLLLRIIEK
ncbi:MULTISPECIES: alpha/beta fold hydrolase [Thermotoga]|uniref:Esterase n=2 Tax=Thermotoga neapolitana TaxID=2337 RepID=B9K784_THENN|nr:MULTISPECIES: alpha/beta fold hydrolase [Thermotoga]ACM22817.1 Esterase [Thermotoga neapolitana DSM 4359]AJG40754.1 esterase [Thermotoga sp. RQ7]HBF10548.1 alpha/beta hydrolase [Thermotoga neapolitana]